MRLLALSTMLLLAAPGLSWAQASADGATLFLRQCGTCHIAKAENQPRQGPNLWGVVGRKAGTYPGFKYSPNFAASDVTWDAEALDAYLANPQAKVAGSTMAYKQANPEIRAKIIAFLAEQHS